MNFKKPALNFMNQGLTEFPAEIFSTPRVYKLNLSHNKIKDIPKDISKLRYLETIDLSGNQIRQLFAKLFELPNLRILILNDNQVITLPQQVEKLKQLKILHLANNKLSSLPIELTYLTNLEELNLTGNLLDNLPLSEGDPFTKLKSLWLSQNPLRDLNTQALLACMPQLKSVYCYSPKLENPVLSKDFGLMEASVVKGNSLSGLKNVLATKPAISKLSELNSQLSSVYEQVVKDQAAVDALMYKLPKFNKMKPATKIFISYSHEDAGYLVKLKRHLKVLNYDFDLDVWDDTKIRSSEKWEVEIKTALEECSIAILLISTDFLASDFIRKDELPPLLKYAKEKGTSIHPVIVHPCRFLQTKSLSQFQAVNSPEEPLSECDAPRQDRIYLKLCNDIQYFLEK